MICRLSIFAAAAALFLTGCADNITGKDDGRWLVTRRAGEVDYSASGALLFATGSADMTRRASDLVARGAADAKKRPRARIEVKPLVPGLPLIGARKRPLTVKARVHNLSTRTFPNDGAQGRRLVRLGAQLCAADGSLRPREQWLYAVLPRVVQALRAAGVTRREQVWVVAPHRAGKRLTVDRKSVV